MQEALSNKFTRNLNARGHFKKATITAKTRREIALRHGCSPGEQVDVKCAYCEFIGSIHWFKGAGRINSHGWVCFENLEMDHRHPEFLGGASDQNNLVLACMPCNRSKGYKESFKNA